MKEVLIEGVIGDWWSDCTPEAVRKAFEAAGDDDVRLTVDSPGGDVWDGISIYNYIRDWTRRHDRTVTTYIRGMAASAAGWIALAASSVDARNKVEVEDNSVFMVHNCQTLAHGDSRTLSEAAEFSARIDSLIAAMLSKRTGRPEEETRELMDAETWYFGREILEAGLADVVLDGGKDGKTGGKSEKDGAVGRAKNAFLDAQNRMRGAAGDDPKRWSDHTRNAVRHLANVFADGAARTASDIDAGKPGEKEIPMTKEEFREQNRALYEEIFNDGILSERERAKAHLKMAADSGDVSAAREFIESGAKCSDDAVAAKYHEVFTQKMLANARAEDRAPDFTPPPNARESVDEATRAFMDAMGIREEK